MRFEYELKFRDWMLFNITHQFLSPWLQFFYVGMSVLMYGITARTASPLASVIVAVIFFSLLWLLQLLFNVIYCLGRNKALLTRHVVELHDDAFYEETEFNKGFHYWPGIAKVVHRPGFAAVYVNALAAHIIPRRAFASDTQLREFVAAIRDRMRNSSRKL